MSLPPHFETPEEYFTECLQFFQEYQYLFSQPNTDVLIHRILERITISDENMQVFDENFDITAVDDEFLNKFFVKLKRLEVFYEDVEHDLDWCVNIAVSRKKQHEIIYLVKEIKEMCEQVECDTVVDFGSGLGYLDQLLFEKTNYRILGIECKESHYVGAKVRQRKYHPNSTDYVKYIKHTVKENSDENIRRFVQEKFEDHRQFCITGLHACADLTIDAINLFLKMDEAKALVIMPCCYHKMVENCNSFKNFPLSICLKDIFRKYNGSDYLKVPFLRVAAQPPSVDEKLEDLVFNLLSRAVLQEYAFKQNCKLKRKKRKAVKTKNMDKNFETYLQDAVANGFELIKKESSDDSNKVENPTFCVEEIMTLWNSMSKVTFKKAGIFILLQNYLQPVIENFVLYDRLVYLKEKGVKHCEFKKILNVNTSPRCLALLAYK
uniref:SFRICE_005615 n=1 Tax=Spodoptera frugiperda TaxID=7108 RepID=A0A2H1VDH6_SPOFR